MHADPSHLHHVHSLPLVVLSIVIAVFASYVALDLANSVFVARGRARLAWLTGGALAMGVGIWSMHFVAMLAFSVPGVQIAYDLPLLFLSIAVAILASALALTIVSREKVGVTTYVLGGLLMGAAIAGMHYIGIASMRMSLVYEWDWTLVYASVAIAVIASFAGLSIAFRFRQDTTRRGIWSRVAGGVVMGLAISGMHYTAMAAMHFRRGPPVLIHDEQLLATSGLAIAVVGTTFLILGIALVGSIVDRALARRLAFTEQIQNQQKWLESVLDLTPTPMVLIEPGTSRIVFANKAADEIAGGEFPIDESPEEFRKRYYSVDEEGQPLPYRENPGVRAAHGEKLKDHQARWRTPKGEHQLVISSDLMPAMHGHPATVVFAFNDVTRLKEVEVELHQAVRARDEFISIASHELKTPITSMKMQVQMLDRELRKKGQESVSPEKLRHMLRTSSRQLDRLNRLVDDMLDISRIATGRLTMELEKDNLSRVVGDILERFKEDCRHAGCELRSEIEAGVVGTFDTFRFEQVITNLLSNAIKYGAGRPIEVSLKRQGADAELRVRDYGIGIAAEAQARIFERFERAVSGASISGLGLGLYIVRSIVESHRGAIRVESEPGKGATFIVTIPLEPEAAKKPPRSEPRLAPDLRNEAPPPF